MIRADVEIGNVPDPAALEEKLYDQILAALRETQPAVASIEKHHCPVILVT
jgi:hypothetical protein